MTALITDGKLVPSVPASLAEALLILQADLPTVAKRQTAKVETSKGSYSYKYAGLQAVSSAILPRLNQLGLVFIARPTLDEGRPVLLCELIHVASGERMPAEYPIAVAPIAPAQAIGSAISYGRRYCLCAMVGVVAEEDDDGRAASMRYDEDREASRRREPQGRRVQNGADELADEVTLRGMFADLNGAGYREKEVQLGLICSAIGRQIESRKELTRGEVAAVRRALREAQNDTHDENPGGGA